MRAWAVLLLGIAAATAPTEQFRGTAALTESGGLEAHTAGLPFPPDAIDPKDAQAGLRWAWNFQARYQGAGFRGRFRVTDLLGRAGRAEPFEGEIFHMQLSHRADRPESKYQVPFAKGKLWVAGGLFRTPVRGASRLLSSLLARMGVSGPCQERSSKSLWPCADAVECIALHAAASSGRKGFLLGGSLSPNTAEGERTRIHTGSTARADRVHQRRVGQPRMASRRARVAVAEECLEHALADTLPQQ